MTPTNSEAVHSFRQRGYQNTKTGIVVMIYGNDPAPTDPSGAPVALIWDQWITTVTTTAPYTGQIVTV